MKQKVMLLYSVQQQKETSNRNFDCQKKLSFFVVMIKHLRKLFDQLEREVEGTHGSSEN